MNRMDRRENNFNTQREEFVRFDNDVDNRNRIFDRNTNTATVRNSGNSTVNIRVNINNED